MLFLYRPRQTWMPYHLPRNLMAQQDYNLQMQQQFEATRQVGQPAPRPDPIGDLKDLAALHESGALDADEFAAAKAKVLGTAEDES